MISKSIFKAYDIRGVVGKTLDADVAERSAARSAATALAKAASARSWSAATAACRARSWSAALAAACAPTGVDVVDIGVVTTPMALLLAAQRAASDGCVERHPGDRQPQPAGLQRLQDGAGAATRSTATTIQALRRRIAGRGLRRAAAARYARRTTSRAAYIERIVGDVQAGAADEDRGRLAATASPARFAPRALRALGCEVDRALLRSRRQLPQPPPGSAQAREPAGPDPRAAGDRRRARPRLRRRRRPPRRRHQGRPDHLSRTAS